MAEHVLTQNNIFLLGPFLRNGLLPCAKTLIFKLGTNHPETGTSHRLFQPRHLQKEKSAHEQRKELKTGVGNLSCNW